MSESTGARVGEVAAQVLEYIYDKGSLPSEAEGQSGLLVVTWTSVESAIEVKGRELEVAVEYLRQESLVSVEPPRIAGSRIFLTAKGLGVVARVRGDVRLT